MFHIISKALIFARTYSSQETCQSRITYLRVKVHIIVYRRPVRVHAEAALRAG